MRVRTQRKIPSWQLPETPCSLSLRFRPPPYRHDGGGEWQLRLGCVRVRVCKKKRLASVVPPFSGICGERPFGGGGESADKRLASTGGTCPDMRVRSDTVPLLSQRATPLFVLLSSNPGYKPTEIHTLHAVENIPHTTSTLSLFLLTGSPWV